MVMMYILDVRGHGLEPGESKNTIQLDHCNAKQYHKLALCRCHDFPCKWDVHLDYYFSFAKTNKYCNLSVNSSE